MRVAPRVCVAPCMSVAPRMHAAAFFISDSSIPRIDTMRPRVASPMPSSLHTQGSKAVRPSPDRARPSEDPTPFVGPAPGHRSRVISL